jgi:hypothetical protein
LSKIVHKTTSLLSCPEFIAQHRTHSKHFTRKRRLTFCNLILFLLNRPKSVLQTELDAFFQALDNDTVFMTCRSQLSRQVCRQSGLDPDTPLRIRPIRVTLPTGETEVLATSLLNTEACPAELFADLYHRRWGIETDCRRLKQTLSLENVSGRTVCAAQQDIHACQPLKNLDLPIQALQRPDIDRKTAHRKQPATKDCEGYKPTRRCRTLRR